MSLLEDKNPKEGLKEFFTAIWGTTIDGFVYLPTKDAKSDSWRKVFFHWPEHIDHIVNHVLVSTAQGLDSYFAPALFENATAANKENVKGTNVLWADFDGTAPSEWPSQPSGDVQGPSECPPPKSPAERLAAPARAQDGIPCPSLRVQSSTDGREHVYWKLDEFTKDIEFVEGSNRSIAYTLRADTGGWDITQVLRPPYTTNYKHDLPVTLVTMDDSKYSQGDFSQLKPVIQLVSESIDSTNLPKVEWLIAKYRWDEKHFNLFMQDGVQLIEDRQRSDALMRIGYYCAEQGMVDEEIFSVVSNAADRWGKFVGRLDRKRRLLDIINRAREKHPQSIETLTFKNLLGEQEAVKGRQYVYGLQDFLESDIKVEWAIEGFIEKGGMGMVSAAPGVGKTQLSLQLAIACALKKDFLGWQPVEEMKVLVFSLEMSHIALKIFLELIAKQYPDDLEGLQKNLQIIPLGQSLPLNRPDSKQFIELMIQEIKPDAVIFDTYGKLIVGKLEEDTAKTVNDYMGVLRSKYNCFVWLVHHNVKPNEKNKKPNQLEDVFGSTYVCTDMTTVLTMWKNKVDGTIELNQVKARLTAEAPTKILTRNEFLTFSDDKEVSENMEKKVKKNVSDPPVGLFNF